MLWAGCTASGVEEPQPQLPREKGNISLRFNIGPVSLTKGDAADGGAFHNLMVIVSTSGSTHIVKRAVFLSENDIYAQVAQTRVEELDVLFAGLELGEYHVDAYANIDHAAWQNTTDGLVSYTDGGGTHSWRWDTSATADANETSLDSFLSGMIEGVFPTDQKLAVLSAPAVPGNPAPQPMLLSGHREVTVGVVDYHDRVQLLRPVGRLNVEINNYTGLAITVKDLHFSAFNPSTAYLMPNWGTGDVPNMPAETTYGDLPGIVAADNVTIPATGGEGVSEQVRIYSTLLYENKADVYKMYATVGSAGNSDMALGHHKIIPRSELTAMAVNDTRTVLLVNPSGNGGRIFGYNSGRVSTTLNSKTESAMMKAVNGVITGAYASYYRLTLTKVSATDYTLKQGSNAVLSGNFKIEEGVPTAASLLPLEETDVVLKLKTGSNYFYNNNGNIASTSSKPNTHTRQWIFMDPDQRVGSNLLYVDPETSRVSPLSFIRRNQDLTVVLNIYFEAGEHSFTFEVKDDNWTTPTTSTHTFQ